MNQYPELPRWAKRKLSKINKKMQQPKPKYQDGSTVIYQGKMQTVIDSYCKLFPSHSWYYNLDGSDLQAIPEDALMLPN